jgi:hypothetical protein
VRSLHRDAASSPGQTHIRGMGYGPCGTAPSATAHGCPWKKGHGCGGRPVGWIVSPRLLVPQYQASIASRTGQPYIIKSRAAAGVMERTAFPLQKRSGLDARIVSIKPMAPIHPLAQLPTVRRRPALCATPSRCVRCQVQPEQGVGNGQSPKDGLVTASTRGPSTYQTWPGPVRPSIPVSCHSWSPPVLWPAARECLGCSHPRPAIGATRDAGSRVPLQCFHRQAVFASVTDGGEYRPTLASQTPFISRRMTAPSMGTSPSQECGEGASSYGLR